MKLFHIAEYCDAPQLKVGSNREYKVCLNERAILRPLDHEFIENYWNYLSHRQKFARGFHSQTVLPEDVVRPQRAV